MFAIDRAGLVGADGQTQGAFDLSFMRCIPWWSPAPSDESECRQMLYTGRSTMGPVRFDTRRGNGMGTEIQSEFTALEVVKTVSFVKTKAKDGARLLS